MATCSTCTRSLASAGPGAAALRIFPHRARQATARVVARCIDVDGEQWGGGRGPAAQTRSGSVGRGWRGRHRGGAQKHGHEDVGTFPHPNPLNLRWPQVGRRREDSSRLSLLYIRYIEVHDIGHYYTSTCPESAPMRREDASHASTPAGKPPCRPPTNASDGMAAVGEGSTGRVRGV